MRTASRPDSISGPCSPRPVGTARRISSVRGPGSPAGSPVSFERVALAVSVRAALVLWSPADQGITNGASGSGDGGLADHDRGVQQAPLAVVAQEPPRAECADAAPVGGDEDERLLVGGAREARRRSAAGSRSRGCWSPPRFPRPRRGGRSAATWRSELPGRVSRRFRRSTSSPSKEASKVCSATSADGIASKRSWTNCGHRLRRPRCRGAGRRTARSCRGSGRPPPRSRRRPGVRVDSIGSGGCCSENMATTSATGAASRAVLQMRRSITSPRRVSGMARGQARILLVDDEQAVQTLLTYPLRKEGYEVVGAHRRAGGPRPLRGAEVRPRRARHHAAEARRDRGLPPPPHPQPGADHHAHREGGRDRQGRRPRDGRGRLHHQALLGPRVPQPRQGRAAAGEHAARALGRRADPRRGPGDRLRAQDHDRPRRAGPADLRRVRDPRRAGEQPRAASSAARACWSRSGATRPTATRAPSTSTYATCARSSRPTRKSPEYLFTVRGVGYRFRDPAE